MLNLKPYQRNAVDSLKQIIDKNLLEDNKSSITNRMLLVAPTGAGKTVITSSLIEEVYMENRNIAFIWVSIGKSGIHQQSKDKCEQFTKSLRLFSPDDIMSGETEYLNGGDALFMNWESISRKNKNKEWANLFMRDGEYCNFTTLLNNTKERNIKIMLIIDEAHASTSTRVEEIISIIDADLHLDVTATPTKKQISRNQSLIVKINSQHVIDEGVIKKGILVNKDLPTEDNVIIMLLKACIKRREYLKTLYKRVNSNVNPLCLIQIPNGVDGDKLAMDLQTILSKLNITTANNKLAIWTTEDKINLDVLKEIDAPQEYLIFKQAIDTGWDCPRAQILLKLRDIKSEVFKEQLLGRLLRMPELKHYNNDILNYAYVYTNEETFDIDKPEHLPDAIEMPTEVILVKDEFEQELLYTVLPSFPKIKIHSKIQSKDFLSSVLNYLVSKLDVFRKLYEDNSTGFVVQIPKDLKVNALNLEIVSSDTTTAKLTPSVIKAIINRQIKSAMQDDNYSVVIEQILNARPKDISLYEYLNIILFNIDYICMSLLELRKASTIYSQVSLDSLNVQYNQIPTEINVYDDPTGNPVHEKNIYKFFPRSLYKYEEYIIDKLESEEDVKWWFYAKTFNTPIIIPVIENDTVNLYSPLLVAKTNDNKLYLIDVYKTEDELKLKASLLSKLLEKANLPNIEYRLVNITKE